MDNEIFLKLYEEQFHIPIIDGSEKIWFFRTQGGTYYFDFYTNSYIAIGWNKIKKNFILLSCNSRRQFVRRDACL